MSTLSNNKHDIVLIDSDTEIESADHQGNGHPPKKKLKLSETNGSENKFLKAFMSSSSESESNSSSTGANPDSNLGIKTNSAKEFFLSGTSQSSSSESDAISSGTNSSALDMISPDEDTSEERNEATASFSITRRVISETRSYLKQRGTMQFLEKYLPTTASSDDLLKLILKLGFFPKDGIPEFNYGDKLIGLIKLLHTAMKKVNSMRTRLDNFYSVDHVLDKIRSAKRILIITGAGISTSLGVPDFRSSKGFYAKLQHLGLSDPQEVFDLDFFHSDPSIFYLIAYMILPPENSYTPLHAFIKLLQSKGKLLRNYTQNIDNLESNVGINPDKLIQCHGSFATASCVTCKYKVKGEKIFPQIRAQEIPYCHKCSKARKILLQRDDAYVPESYGVMKPDITFFGEPLPSRFHDMIKQDLSACDLIISIGTSLKVAPVANIVENIPDEIPQILINKDPIDHCNFDVSLLGYCDDTASYLCNHLGKGWDINHPNYNKILGEDGKNLELITINEDEGHYSIRNKIEELNAIKIKEISDNHQAE